MAPWTPAAGTAAGATTEDKDVPETTGKKREPPISYRPPVALRAEFDRRVERSGLSISAFITKAVFAADPPRQSRRPAASQEEIARLLGQAAAIREALDQLAAGRHHDGQIRAAVEGANLYLREMRAACFRALGRQP